MHSGGTWRLGHRPALDGLRAIAVLMVIAFHVLGSKFPAGGVVGVTIFFTLSGFLITSLLLDERDRHGSASLPRFYRRRALRLLPALIVMLAIGGSLAVASGESQPSDVLAVLFYVANVWQAGGHELGILVHTWTLATEEQFYLLWPVALVVVMRTRRPLLLVSTVAVSMMAARIALVSAGVAPGVVYYTGGDALLAGCALALWMRSRPASQSVPRPAVLVLLAATAATCWLPWSTGVVAVVATGLAVALLMLMVRSTDEGVWVLSTPVLRAVGDRSYGLYLWHLPIIAIVWRFGVAAGLPFWVFITIALLILAGVAELSWRFVEQPFLRMKDRSVVGGVLPRRRQRVDADVVEIGHLGG